MPPLLARQRSHQIQLDALGVRMFRQAEALCDPQDVRVDGNSLIFLETRPQDDRCGLTSHPRQLCQILHLLRHFAAMLLQEDVAQSLDVLRFRAVEATCADIRLELDARHADVILRFLVLGIQDRLRHMIDPHVGALRREYGRDEQIERCAEREERPLRRVALAERLQNSRRR